MGGDKRTRPVKRHSRSNSSSTSSTSGSSSTAVAEEKRIRRCVTTLGFQSTNRFPKNQRWGVARIIPVATGCAPTACMWDLKAVGAREYGQLHKMLCEEAQKPKAQKSEWDHKYKGCKSGASGSGAQLPQRGRQSDCTRPGAKAHTACRQEASRGNPNCTAATAGLHSKWQCRGQITLAQQVEAEAQRRKTLMQGAEAKKWDDAVEAALAEGQTVLGKVRH